MESLEKLDDIIVVKVGTSTLTEKIDDKEYLNLLTFREIGKQIIELADEGHHVVVVTSASITAGMIESNTKQRPDPESEIPESQRLSAIGWRNILNAWDDALPERITAGLLLTKHELEMDDERQRAIRTIHTMLANGDIPIINENDPISYEEIEYGDNDKLAANIATRIKASDLFGSNINLVMLTNKVGVCENPKDENTLISRIENLEEYWHLATEPEDHLGTGGMITKFEAAEIAKAAKIDMWIADGKRPNSIKDAIAGKSGTYFPAA